jgi:hypothetical protein
LTRRTRQKMTKRAVIIGIGGMVGMRIARHVGGAMRRQLHHKMREHCKQMVSQCKQVAADSRDREPAATAT